MADFAFENPTFDPDMPGIDDDYSSDLPNDAIMDPPLHVLQELNTSGDRSQSPRGELREAELEPQKKRLVDIYYKEPGRIAQSVGHVFRKSEVLGSIPSLATYFRFSVR